MAALYDTIFLHGAKPCLPIKHKDTLHSAAEKPQDGDMEEGTEATFNENYICEKQHLITSGSQVAQPAKPTYAHKQTKTGSVMGDEVRQNMVHWSSGMANYQYFFRLRTITALVHK